MPRKPPPAPPPPPDPSSAPAKSSAPAPWGEVPPEQAAGAQSGAGTDTPRDDLLVRPAPGNAPATRFPCDSCGADMRFSPGTGEMVCDFCGNRTPIEGTTPEARAQAVTEMDFDRVLSGLDQAEMEETIVLPCPNCGAQVTFGSDVHAMACPFCATPLVAGTGTHRHIKPRALLPFELNERQARAAMTDWLGGLWFAPNGLRAYARKGRKMAGIYVPYWTYDADTASSYSGQRGTIYYVTETVMRNGKQAQVQRQRIRWQPVSGRVARWFDDVLVLGSTSLPKKFTDALAPWDLAALEPYAPEYLAGFVSEGYTVDPQDGFAEARQIMDATIRRDVRFDIGGDRQQIAQVQTRVSDVTFKHILLPVWLAAYKYQGKTYRFVVNARTGAVQGERPYSAIKIAIAVIFGLIVAGIAGYFYALQQGAV